MDSEKVHELSKRHIDFSEVKCLPSHIREMVGHPEDHRRLEVLEYFLANSEVCRILYKNPADFEMLEYAYFWRFVRPQSGDDSTDRWLCGAPSAQALRDRLAKVSDWVADHLSERVCDGNSYRVLDLGAGPGPYALGALEKLREKNLALLWDCIDLDRLALAIGTIRAHQAGLDGVITFRAANFMSSSSEPNDDSKADFGLLIGILCGMSPENSTQCLHKIKPHFKPGAEIMAATLLKKVFMKTPTCSESYAMS